MLKLKKTRNKGIANLLEICCYEAGYLSNHSGSIIKLWTFFFTMKICPNNIDYFIRPKVCYPFSRN